MGRRQQFPSEMFLKKDKMNGCYSAATRRFSGPEQTTPSFSEHCNANDPDKKPNSIWAASICNADHHRYFTCPIWSTGEPKLRRTSHYSPTRSCCSMLAFNESSLTDIFQPKEYSNELPQCFVKPAQIALCICGLCLVLPFEFLRLRHAESRQACTQTRRKH